MRLKEERDQALKRLGAILDASKEQSASSFCTSLRGIPESDILVFTDGSRLDNGMAGADFVVYQTGHHIFRKLIHLGPNLEVFDAEAQVALAGTLAAIVFPATRFASNFWIFLDNLEVALRLLSSTNDSSQETLEKYLETTSMWQKRQRLPYNVRGKVHIRWVPGNFNILGNETADKAARKGAVTAYPIELAHSHASPRKWANSVKTNTITKLWSTVAPKSNCNLEIDKSPSILDELSLPRSILGHILCPSTLL